MNWHDKEDEGEEKEENQFHIPEPDDWEEPEVGVDLPPEPPEPPEIEQTLDPQEAIQKSEQRVQEKMEQQFQTGNNAVQQDPGRKHVNTHYVDDTPEQQPVETEHTEDQDLNELNRRINIADKAEPDEPAEPVESQETSSETSDASDQELVDKIIEVHTDIARANEHRDDLEPILEDLSSALQSQGIETIEPGPGDELDYYRHTVINTVDSSYPDGTIVELVRPGYENSEHVLEEALVKTSNGRSDR